MEHFLHVLCVLFREWANQWFDTVYKMTNLFIYPLGFTHSVCVFGFRIRAAVHLAVDGIFSLCFAAGFRGQDGMINQPLTDELIHCPVQRRTTIEVTVNSVQF